MAPVQYSAEWNASCALRPATIRDDSTVSPAYFQFNYFLIAFVAVYYPIGLIAFWYSKKQIRTSYLAKRSFLPLVLSTIGVYCMLGCGPIRDVTGRDKFPCALSMWLRLIAVMNVLMPISTRLIFFREQMLWSKAKKSISFQKLQEIIASETVMPTPSPRKSIFRGAAPINARVSGITDLVPSSSDDAERQSEATSQLSSERKGLSSNSSQNEEQFERIMKRQSFAFKATVTIIPCIPLLIFGLVYQLALPYMINGCVGCNEDLTFYLIIMGTVFGLIAVVVITGYLVRNSPDPLGLLFEIKWILIICTPLAGVGMLLLIIDDYIGRPNDRGVFSFDWMVIIALVIMYTWLAYVPLLIAYRMNQKVAGARYEFASFLNNQKAYKLFAEHLANEWAVENIKFWSQVESFRGQYAHFKKVKDGNLVAIQTYNTFIKPGALMDVNIPSVMRDDLIRKFENHAVEDPDFTKKAIPSTIFDDAQKEIFALMEKDSFQRWQSTKTFKDFVSGNTVLDANKQRLIVVTSGT